MSSHYLRLSLLSVLLVVCVQCVYSQEWTPSQVGVDESKYKMFWSDEFNYDGSPDGDKWHLENEAWPHNGELQYYSDSTDFVYAADGKLHIKADKVANGGREYTSGRIDTAGKQHFKEGLFAARIKGTHSQAIWPAFWLFCAEGQYAEIDIWEGAGGTSAKEGKGYGDDSAAATNVYHKIPQDIYNVYRIGHAIGNSIAPAKFADDFHVFWLLREKDKITSGMDTKILGTIDIRGFPDVQDQAMYMILNVAVGGYYPGNPDATTVLPQILEVDWVKVWSVDGTQHPAAGTPFVLPFNPPDPDKPTTSTGGDGGGSGSGSGGDGGSGSGSGTGGVQLPDGSNSAASVTGGWFTCLMLMLMGVVLARQ